MDEQNHQATAEELAGEKMVDEAFQRLLDSYLASRHRKKVDLITKALTLHARHIKVSSDFQVNLTSCTPLPWHR